jgi:starch synthase
MSTKKNNLKILLASAECAPFAKTGGLGDVLGSLPGPLKKLGNDVRVIIPKYGSIDAKKYKLKKIKSNIKIISNKKVEKINLWLGQIPGSRVPIYFIDSKKYFGSDKVYFATKFDSERFLFFSLASLQILPLINFKPDVIHCHDYHAGFIPDLIKTGRGIFPSLIESDNDEAWNDIKTVYTIHNFIYQGQAEVDILSTGNLTKNSLASLSVDAKDGDINFVVQAILNSNAITTVSPTYSKEIMTKEFGAGLEKIVKRRKKDLVGIINGIDMDFFNPKKDKSLYKKYDYKSLDKKKENKANLQKKLGLPVKDIPLVGLVSRLTWQKGVDLITEKFADLDCQFVFLGTGEKIYEKHLDKLSKKYPEKISTKIMFDVGLANQIYAGSDVFLMPSRFEPCGLGQMISMRYGTIPLVRETGGLKDTVPRLSEGEEKLTKVNTIKAKGFSFKKLSSNVLYKELERAIQVYYNKKKVWKKIQVNGMREDFSWDNSAKKYLNLYKKVIKK